MIFFATGALRIVRNYILGLIWGHDSTIYLFDLYSKCENGNLSSFSRAALLKFDILHSLEIYIKSVYYNTYLPTLCFKKEGNHNKKTRKHYQKQKYLENPTQIILFQTAKYQENCEVHLVYNKCRYHENP